tara:strand:- start:910 stop:1101 length:192 start_codon:yes stop_codon:yes gene_type:complete
MQASPKKSVNKCHLNVKYLILLKLNAHIAQLVEHFHGKEKVACSIQAVGTTLKLFSFYLKISR